MVEHALDAVKLLAIFSLRKGGEEGREEEGVRRGGGPMEEGEGLVAEVLPLS